MERVRVFLQDTDEDEVSYVGSVVETTAARIMQLVRSSQRETDGDSSTEPTGQAAKTIQVMNIDHEIFDPFVEAGIAQPVKKMDVFSGGGIDLSRHLGYKSNQAVQALYRAKREKQEDEATLRGVSFRYLSYHD